jgi:AAA+ superfamily predicted ATPase
MSDVALLAALKQALDRDPRNGPLWLHYADLLAGAGHRDDAITALRTAVELTDDRRAAIRRLVPLLRAAGHSPEALVRAERFLETEDDPAIRLEYARILHSRGETEEARVQYQRACAADPALTDAELETLAGNDEAQGSGLWAHNSEPGTKHQAPLGLDGWPSDDERQASEARSQERERSDPRAGAERPPSGSDSDPRARAPVSPEGVPPDDWAAGLDWDGLYLTFADVAGLQEVKNQIHLRIIAPFQNPEIYRAFRRSGGGGILLYGPPGCGKTFLARATAGEVGARFLAVGIHELLDAYWGQSEKLMHALFEEARRRAPTVLFLDEFDALGSHRGRTESQYWKTLVDQLLQEMDGMGGRNEDVLIFAATNVPWNVDSAFRRPGRFDRILFVPPPDEEARVAILRRHSAKLPGAEGIAVEKLAQQTALMTGADLKALCERASERALSRSLETGTIHPVTMADFERELKLMQTSASEWLATARNYARYSNEGGQYDELTEFLKRVKRW